MMHTAQLDINSGTAPSVHEITTLEKNTTRISSLLGTWTSQTHMKADIGHYEVLAYFVVHLMPDPMRGYGCSLPDCKEIENNVCMTNQEGGVGDYKEKCLSMTDRVVDWSDVVAFMYFGAKVDAGIPFNVHKHHSTGGWVGPFSVIMAQNTTTITANTTSDDDDDTRHRNVDHYVVRYVVSPTTSYLQMPPECDLNREEDFERYMGPQAVNNTVHMQYRNGTSDDDDDDDDPYAKYLGTCDNGDVKPILPLYEFKFVVDTATGKESVEVKLDYKLLTIPKKTDIMYKVFPRLQKRVNRNKGEFHISGPYCYGDDPNRGYTFDLNYDSRHENKYISLVHGCVEGLPCLPPAANISADGAASERIIHDIIHDKGATIHVGGILFLSLGMCFMGFLLLYSLLWNWRFVQQKQRLARQLNDSDGSVERRELEMEIGGNGGGGGGDDEDVDHFDSLESLSAPLLSKDDDDRGQVNGGMSSTKETDEDAAVTQGADAASDNHPTFDGTFA